MLPADLVASLAAAPMPDPDQARAVVALLRERLAAQGLALREPPTEPTTCCGRGCNGCVWEGWLAAMQWWREDAITLLTARS